jgi:hypothetical protein
MIVRVDDEDAIDDLVEEVEHATLPTLDPDAEHTVYEMAEWTAEQQSRLSNMLGMAGLAHEFDRNGDLVVNAEDEDAVDSGARPSRRCDRAGRARWPKTSSTSMTTCSSTISYRTRSIRRSHQRQHPRPRGNPRVPRSRRS